MQESDLFGAWRLDANVDVFCLTLQPDHQYRQVWDKLPGADGAGGTGEIVHQGAWKLSWLQTQPFLVLTLATADPPMDLGAFGWQPALAGSSKTMAIAALDGDALQLSGARLVRVAPLDAAQIYASGMAELNQERRDAQQQQINFDAGLVQTSVEATIKLIKETPTAALAPAKPISISHPKPIVLPRRR